MRELEPSHLPPGSVAIHDGGSRSRKFLLRIRGQCLAASILVSVAEPPLAPKIKGALEGLVEAMQEEIEGYEVWSKKLGFTSRAEKGRDHLVILRSKLQQLLEGP